MTTMALARPRVTGGVDTHRDTNVAAAVNDVGGVLATATFPTTKAGHRQLLTWLRSCGELDSVGVEGTGSYGAGLARHLSTAGVAVVEVGRPNRQVRRRHGKTDVVDAIAAARSVLSGESTAIPKSHDGPVEALRALKLLQRSATKARTAAINELRALILTAPDELRDPLRNQPLKALLATCSAFRVTTTDDSLSGILRLTLRALAQRITFLTTQHATALARISRICTATAPELMAKKGFGADTCSALLLAAGDNPHRLHNEAAFASLLGSSPIPVNSGQTQNRYRLNRGGDRQANSALWRIAIVRMATDQATKDYITKRINDGKTKAEAIRCLKRYIAREAFNALPQALTTAPH